MARKAVTARRCSIRLACQALSISQTCYRYQAKLKHENAVIADWLVR
jgi:putative transposase